MLAFFKTHTTIDPHIYAQIHTHTHAVFIYIHTHTCSHAFGSLATQHRLPDCIHTYTHTHPHAWMQSCFLISGFSTPRPRSHTYIHTYIHAYIHTYIHTHMHAVILSDLWVLNTVSQTWREIPTKNSPSVVNYGFVSAASSLWLLHAQNQGVHMRIIYTCMRTCAYLDKRKCHTYMCIHVHTCAYNYTNASAIRTYMCIHVRACAYPWHVHTHIHTSQGCLCRVHSSPPVVVIVVWSKSGYTLTLVHHIYAHTHTVTHGHV
jgi:hypothetical protein